MSFFSVVEQSIGRAFAALQPFRGFSVQYICGANTLNAFIKTVILITLTHSWGKISGDIFSIIYWCIQSYCSLLKRLQKTLCQYSLQYCNLKCSYKQGVSLRSHNQLKLFLIKNLLQLLLKSMKRSFWLWQVQNCSIKCWKYLQVIMFSP